MASFGEESPQRTPKPKPLITDGRRIHRETGSPFDSTRTRHELMDPPGTHERCMTPPNPTAFSTTGARISSPKPDPRAFLCSRSGFGGAAATVHRGISTTSLRPATASPVLSRSGYSSGFSASGELAVSGRSYGSPHSGAGATASPPKAGATSPRRNPPNTELRRFYERSDLPCMIDAKGAKNRLAWKVPFEKLDYAHYLPLFFDGLREEEQPYKFIAIEGTKALLEHGGSRILPVVPHLIVPIRNCLNTRRPAVMVQALNAVRALILSDVYSPEGPNIGKTLVPYYRQLLPVLNIFILHNKNLGDKTDYGQRHGQVLGDKIDEILNLMETYGGEDAFINIKYLIPTYQSCVAHK